MEAKSLRDNIQYIPAQFHLFNVLLFVIYIRRGQRVKFLPITFKNREKGCNSVNFRKIMKIGVMSISDFRKIPMNFTSQIFLFGFFPICFAAYFVVELLENRTCLSRMIQKFKFKDLIVIGISFFFYMWACFDGVFWLYFYIVGVYGAGLWIQYLYYKGLYIPVFRVRNKEASVCEKKISLSVFPLFITILAVLFFLIYFKYTGFLAKVWNWMFGSSWSVSTGLAPLGISFFTFSAISYLADISRGSASCTGFSGKLYEWIGF